MFQTDDKKLQRKFIAEDLDYDNTVKYGLALEQGAKKVVEIRGAMIQRRMIMWQL